MKYFVCLLILLLPVMLFAQEVEVNPPQHYIVGKYLDNTGKEVTKMVAPGKKPATFRMPVIKAPATAVMLSNAPAYDWCFGCSATSAAMLAGYYDNNGYPEMYTGITNGGVAPLDNSIWGTALINGATCSLCPLSATRMGLDGRDVFGHVDDYWIMAGNSDPDPYITGGWTQHEYGDCTGDFMKTNQSEQGNTDGQTIFYYYTDGSPISPTTENDGIYGLKLFIESRGYTVTSYYNQYIRGFNGNTNGCTFEQYKQLIDNQMPVLIQVSGHTMLGVGYDEASNKVYVHDTWDYATHEMIWGDSYAGMEHVGISVLAMPCRPVATINEQFNVNMIPLCWTQSHSNGLGSDRWNISYSGYAGSSPSEMVAAWTGEYGTSRLISPPLNTSGIDHLQLSFLTFYDDWGTGATLKIQSSSDLLTWTDESWSYATGSGNIEPGTLIDLSITNNIGDTTYVAWVIEGDHYQFDAWYIDSVSIVPQTAKQLQLVMFPEGMLEPGGIIMHKARNEAGDAFPGDIADTINIELHNANSPFEQVGNTLTANLSINGLATVLIPSGLNGSYYLVIKHRNSLETWSSVPVSFSGNTINYNFTDAAGRAYGNNLKLVNGKYCLFAGDVNQDNVVDQSDADAVFLSSAAFETGYLPNDVNGDSSIDGLDLVITDNNAALFVTVKKP